MDRELFDETLYCVLLLDLLKAMRASEDPYYAGAELKISIRVDPNERDEPMVIVPVDAVLQIKKSYEFLDGWKTITEGEFPFNDPGLKRQVGELIGIDWD